MTAQPAPQQVDATCVVCSLPFSYDRGTERKRRRLCSPECKAKRAVQKGAQYRSDGRYRERERRDKQAVIGERQCSICSKAFPVLRQNPKTLCCGTVCGKVLAKRRATEVRRANVAKASPRPQRVCKQCKVSFVYRPRNGPGIFCSNRCKFSARRLYATKAEAKHAESQRRKARLGAPRHRLAECQDCGTAFRTRFADKVYCSRCAYRNRERPHRPCVQCGKSFVPMNGQTICSDRCRRKRNRQLPNVKIGRALARARRRSVLHLALIERVDPIAVFQRDRWRCQLCWDRTPKKLVGTNDLRAPTLDHIIALASGGEHSYRNSQCACRDCNNRKRDLPMGQLRLFG